MLFYNELFFSENPLYSFRAFGTEISYWSALATWIKWHASKRWFPSKFGPAEKMNKRYHKNLPIKIGIDISKQTIQLSKGIENPIIILNTYLLKLPALYFHNIGIDILPGNNFLR